MRKIELLKGYEDSLDSFEEFTRKFWLTATSEQLTWRDNPKDWNVSEVMAHLIEYFDHYQPKIERAINSSILAEDDSEYKYSPVGEMILSQIDPNPAQLEKMYQSGHFEGNRVEAKDPNIAQEFLNTIDKFRFVLHKARNVNIAEATVLSKFDKNFSFQLGDCLELILRHKLLHWNQAQVIMYKYNQYNNTLAR